MDNKNNPDTYWPIISPWSVLSDQWAEKFEAEGLEIDEQTRMTFWIETVICGIFLAKHKRGVELDSQEDSFERDVLTMIVDLSRKESQSSEHRKKSIDLLFMELQKRKEIFKRRQDEGVMAITGNFYGLLKNDFGSTLPDESLQEYAVFKIKQFEDLFKIN